MQLVFRQVTANDSPCLKDIQLILDAERDRITEMGFPHHGKEIARIQEGSQYILAYDENHPVGFVQFAHYKEGKYPSIVTWRSLVHPDMRRNRIATQLTQWIIGYARKHHVRRIIRGNLSDAMVKLAVEMRKSPRRNRSGKKMEEHVVDQKNQTAFIKVKFPRLVRRSRK